MLGTPPAFILSQDQTLSFECLSLSKCRWLFRFGFVNCHSVYCSLGNESFRFVRSNLQISLLQIPTSVLAAPIRKLRWIFIRIFKVVSLFDYQGTLPSRFDCSVTASACTVYHRVFCLSTTFFIFFKKVFLMISELVWRFELLLTTNGERGIWTLAPVARPTPLAGAPLQPLEYFSLAWNYLTNMCMFHVLRLPTQMLLYKVGCRLSTVFIMSFTVCFRQLAHSYCGTIHPTYSSSVRSSCGTYACILHVLVSIW